MRKIYRVLAVALCVCLLLSGCGGKVKDKLYVTATNFAEYDFARAVAGDLAEIELLIPAGTDVHSFEPTARDILNIGKSDIFIFIGGESEEYLEQICDTAKGKNTAVLRLSDYVSLCEEEHSHGSNHHSHDEGYDEHIWLSPSNALTMISVICSAFCTADPENAAIYTANAEQYIIEIGHKAAETAEVVNNAENKIIAVADRNPYKYFTEYYGLQAVAAFSSCSADTDPPLGTVLKLIETVKENSLSAIFVTELGNRELANTVANSTGAEILILNSYHNVSLEDFQSGVTYLELMEQNRQNLERGLN